MNGISFTDKVAIITGASSGIGAETAKCFAEYGAKLTLIGRNQMKLESVAVECKARNGLTPLCILIDLTHPGSCEAVVSKTAATYGRIDVLVNCAGKGKVSSLFDQSMEIFDELMAINLRVPYHLTQLALPHLIKTKGNIINVASSMLKRHRPGFLPYVVSKSALERFTKHAAPELAAEGVRINAISPGVTRTNILDNLNFGDRCQDLVYRTIAEQLPNGTIIEPKEVAILICLTASDLFPNLNGSNFLIDGAACMA